MATTRILRGMRVAQVLPLAPACWHPHHVEESVIVELARYGCM
jgi:hypothetical protein